jgi:hypothetical protein
MSTKFNMARDINGYNGFGLIFTDTAYSCTLTASTDTTLTIPANMGLGGGGLSQSSQWIAIFNFDPGSSVWVASNAVASNPAGGSFAATSSELNPSARLIKGGDVLHFYTTGTGVNVSVLLYLFA